MSDVDQLTERIRRAFSQPAPRVDPGVLIRRGRQARARRRTETIAGAALVVSGLVLGAAFLVPFGHTGPSGEPASRAQVACDGDLTRVLTPSVTAQADGVHLDAWNDTHGDLLLDLRTRGGYLLPPGATTIVAPLPPGPVDLRCASTSEDLGEDPSSWGTIEVVDPRGWWIPAEIECGEAGYVAGISERMAPPPDSELEAIARRELGLVQGDVLERAGYPRSEEPTFIQVRDGRTVGVWTLQGTIQCRTGEPAT